MKRSTSIVGGPLAFKMRRIAAARADEHGLDVLTLPLVAARLAGGFIQPASQDQLQRAVRDALDAGGFRQIEGIRRLPGAPRAVLHTLSAAWKADVRLAERREGGPRLADLALIEERVRAALPVAAMIAPDLRDAGLARIGSAARLLGEVTLEGVVDVDLVWRPLVRVLAEVTTVRWKAPRVGDRRWFNGELVEPAEVCAVPPRAEVCADPRSEVVEALRWARGLLSSGEVQACEIGLAAVGPQAWDEHMLVLGREAGLPIHFTHGLPALDTHEGQACAALADVLLNGISQVRVRRLLRRAPLAGLPDDWARGLRRAAGLFSVEHWRRALGAARAERASGEAAEQMLIPLVSLLARGASAAGEAGEQLLDGLSLRLWRASLDAAPAEALVLSLEGLRAADATQVGGAVSWGPAAHLAAAPRAHMRLLGLSARAWPRGSTEDPILPDHILGREVTAPRSRSQEDVDLFEVLSAGAAGSLVLSRGRRAGDGALQPPSRLWPRQSDVLARTRIPAHAFSESDRLLARPLEAVQAPLLACGRLCWTNWGRPGVTAHDGVLTPADAVLARTLAQPQSTTSLQRLLRDPLGFVWRYALGWNSLETAVTQLSLDARAFGELVHELLRRAVDALEPHPGFARASEAEVEAAVTAAGDAVALAWPLVRAVPPQRLWRRTVDEAVRMAVAALVFDDVQTGTRSWTEAPFGESALDAAPWDAAQPVRFGALAVRGRIDRLDLQASGEAARVTDYKTGAQPRRAAVLGHGAELQRVIYAAAARQLLPDLRHAVSRLLYLRDGPVSADLRDEPLDAAIGEAERFVRIAVGRLQAGAAPPGPGASDSYNELRLALPAALDPYLRRKSAGLQAAAGELVALWDRP